MSPLAPKLVLGRQRHSRQRVDRGREEEIPALDGISNVLGGSVVSRMILTPAADLLAYVVPLAEEQLRMQGRRKREEVRVGSETGGENRIRLDRSRGRAESALTSGLGLCPTDWTSHRSSARVRTRAPASGRGRL